MQKKERKKERKKEKHILEIGEIYKENKNEKEKIKRWKERKKERKNSLLESENKKGK